MWPLTPWHECDIKIYKTAKKKRNLILPVTKQITQQRKQGMVSFFFFFPSCVLSFRRGDAAIRKWLTTYKHDRATGHIRVVTR